MENRLVGAVIGEGWLVKTLVLKPASFINSKRERMRLRSVFTSCRQRSERSVDVSDFSLEQWIDSKMRVLAYNHCISEC